MRHTNVRVVLTAFFLGAMVGLPPFIWHEFAHKPQPQDNHNRFQKDTLYQFINPLLECAEADTLSEKATAAPLQANVEEYIAAEKETGVLADASVYYRDLNVGPWFGINESKAFHPASLLKIPLALGMYSEIENDPTFDAQTFVYTPDLETENIVQPYASGESLKSGEAYTIDQLVVYMLKESDNAAAVLLSSILGESKVKKVYSDVGLTPPVFGKDYETNTRTYGAFLRILYNATYLTRKHSEHLLQILSTASFRDGLVAGVPASIIVAHKFGSRATVNDTTSVQLHDCGIIYLPGHPYLLCIMTQGNRFDDLAKTIKHISKMIYDYQTTI